MNGNDERRAEVRSYLVGYAGAIVMTGVAFAIVQWLRQNLPSRRC